MTEVEKLEVARDKAFSIADAYGTSAMIAEKNESPEKVIRALRSMGDSYRKDAEAITNKLFHARQVAYEAAQAQKEKVAA